MRDLDWIEKGSILINSGVVHEGIRQYSNAISVAPETSRPYFKKAEILLEEGLIEDAQTTVNEGLNFDPDSFNGNLIKIRTMKPEEILISMDKLLSKFPDSVILKKTLASMLVELAPLKALDLLGDDSSDELLLRLQCFRNLSEYDNAYSIAIKLTNAYPNLIEGWIAAGWIAFDLDLYKESSDFFDMAIGLDRYSLEALSGKAVVLKKIGKDYTLYATALTALDSDITI